MATERLLLELESLDSDEDPVMVHRAGRCVMMRFTEPVSESELVDLFSQIIDRIRDPSVDLTRRVMYAYTVGTVLWQADRAPVDVIVAIADLARQQSVPESVRVQLMSSISHPAESYTTEECSAAIEQITRLSTELVPILPDDAREHASRVVERLKNPIDISQVLSFELGVAREEGRKRALKKTLRAAILVLGIAVAVAVLPSAFAWFGIDPLAASTEISLLLLAIVVAIVVTTVFIWSRPKSIERGRKGAARRKGVGSERHGATGGLSASAVRSTLADDDRPSQTGEALP